MDERCAECGRESMDRAELNKAYVELFGHKVADSADIVPHAPGCSKIMHLWSYEFEDYWDHR